MPLVFVVLMQESYYLFHSNNTSSPYPVWGLDLLCICELQELTFLQLIFFTLEDKLCL